jgi:hypothetical protein
MLQAIQEGKQSLHELPLSTLGETPRPHCLLPLVWFMLTASREKKSELMSIAILLDGAEGRKVLSLERGYF